MSLASYWKRRALSKPFVIEKGKRVILRSFKDIKPGDILKGIGHAWAEAWNEKAKRK